MSDLVTFYVLARDAFDLLEKQVFIKAGPVGTTSLIAEPHSSVLINEFAEKHGITVSQGSDFIMMIEGLADEQQEKLVCQVQALEEGAKASNMEFRDYTEAYLKGIDPNNPPNHNKH